MSASPVDPSGSFIDAGTGDECGAARNRPLTRPWPGHADLLGILSYDLSNVRPALERVNAHGTAARVALGMFTETLLRQIASACLMSHIVSAGTQYATASLAPTPADETALCEASMRTPDSGGNARFKAAVNAAKQAGDTTGGVAGVIAYDVPVGLGTHVTTCKRLNACLAAALMSIQSVKGVEIGDGFTQAAPFGSVAHDEIVQGEDGHLARIPNHVGDIEGGTSNGVPTVTRAAFKPISTVLHVLHSVDLATDEEAVSLYRRSDTCQVVLGTAITEAEVALVLADALSDHTGGRSVGEMRRSLEAYLAVAGERA